MAVFGQKAQVRWTENLLRQYFAHDLGWGSDNQAQIVFSFLRDAADAARGGVVLDAGAGHQRYKPFFCDSVYVAQEHPVAGKENKGLVEYDILADVRHIPLRAESVDVVLSTSSLEHMEYPHEFFAEAHRVLKPGGALYVNVPFVYSEHEIPFDFQRPTRYGLRRWYTHAGFDSVSVRPTTSSTVAAAFFFGQSVREDGRRLGGSLRARIARRACWLAAVYVSRATVRMLDQGPFEDTIFPIGWVAKGHKEGTKNTSAIYSSVTAFLEDCATLSLSDPR